MNCVKSEFTCRFMKRIYKYVQRTKDPRYSISVPRALIYHFHAFLHEPKWIISLLTQSFASSSVYLTRSYTMYLRICQTGYRFCHTGCWHKNFCIWIQFFVTKSLPLSMWWMLPRGPTLQRKSHSFLGIARPQSQFPHSCTLMYLWAIYVFPGLVHIFPTAG